MFLIKSLAIVFLIVIAFIIGYFLEKINDKMGQWYRDYTIYSITHPCAIDRKIYELAKKYESVNKIITFIYSFIYDFNKMKKLSVKLTISIEIVTCLYRFIKICYAESWIG